MGKGNFPLLSHNARGLQLSKGNGLRAGQRKSFFMQPVISLWNSLPQSRRLLKETDELTDEERVIAGQLNGSCKEDMERGGVFVL